MSDWKTRGYVPDSDDEDDDLSLIEHQARDKAESANEALVKAEPSHTKNTSQSRQPLITPPEDTTNESTASQLQKVLSLGLQSVRDVLATAPLIDGHHDDTDDSPLSSPPSSIIGSPSTFAASKNDPIYFEDELDALSLQANDVTERAPRRSLRARAPIQEHPYMLEDARYRQLMKGVGIKPVNLPAVERSAEMPNQDEESQQTELFESYQPDESSGPPISSSPLSLQSLPDHVESRPQFTTSQGFDLSDDDNDLPDVTQILRDRDRTASRLRRGKVKSSRILRGSSSILPVHERIKDASVDRDTANSIHDLSPRNQNFQVPPSPPRSDDHWMPEDNTDDDGVLLNQPGGNLNTPRALPTPLMSSTGHARKRPVAIVSSSESTSSAEEEEERDGDNSSSASRSGKDDSQGILSIKQKLRGVLPPSWVKIDMQNQASARSRDRALPQPATSTNERGVARRIVAGSARRTELATNNAFPIDSVDESDSDESIQPLLVTPRVSTEDNIFAEDVVVEDTIDHMLPQMSRKPARPRRRHQSQGRLDDGWAIVSRRSAADASAAGISGRGRGTSSLKHNKHRKDNKRMKTKHKSTQPQMLVLDAPDLRDLDKKNQPRFLKLAARQARGVKPASQQSGSKKFFLLATEDDTKDVNDQIEAWRHHRNTHRQQKPVASADFAPNTTDLVADVSSTPDHNYSSATRVNSKPDTARDLTSLKRSTHTLLTTIHASRVHRFNSSATSRGEESFTAEDQSSKKISHLKSLLAHRNRAGRGQLLCRVPEPRDAQVETSHTSNLPAQVLPLRNAITLKRQLPTRAPRLTEKVQSGRAEITTDPKLKPRQPRKQMPRLSTVPTARMEHEASFDMSKLANYLTVPGLVEEPVQEDKLLDDGSAIWADSVIHAVESFRLDQISLAGGDVGDLFSDHGGYIAAIYRLYNNTGPRPEELQDLQVRAEPQKSIFMPTTHEWVVCKLYDAQVRDVISASLNEVQQILFTSDNATNSAESYENSIKTVTSVFNYTISGPHSSVFDADGDRVFVPFLFGRIEEFLTAFESRDMLSDEPRRSTVLCCLNWLAASIMYLHTTIERYTLIETRSRDLYLRIIERSFEVILHPKHLMLSLKKLEASMDEGLINNSFVEAQTVVIAQLGCEMVCIGNDRMQLFDVLKSVLSRMAWRDWASHLALTLLTFCLVLPLTPLGPYGKWSSLRFDGRMYVPLNLLAAHVSSIVAQVPSERVTLSGGKLLEAVVDLSLTVSGKVRWAATGTLLTTLLKAYTWNAMLPFGTTPDAVEMFDDHRCLLEEHHNCHKNDFCKFLELVESCINVPRGSITTTRGLIFSLVPNNARITEAQEQLEGVQFLALKNHFALYITLFTKSIDGCQPRIEQLERQVDFSKSHASICRLAVTTWKAIALNFIRRPDPEYETLKGLSKWMNAMLLQSITCIEEYQQFAAISLIEELLGSFADVVACCNSELTARTLLLGNTFETIAQLVSRTEIHRNNESVITSGLKLLYAYANLITDSPNENAMINEVHLVLKKVIQQTLNNSTIINKDLMHYLMAAWFVIAQNLVRSFHKHWNDFIEPHSNLSIDFLSGLRNSYAIYEAKQCFYSNLIKTDPSYFFLEARPVVFMTWVATLLLPVQSMRFTHFLTNSILKNEKDSLMIKDLAALLLEHDNSRELSLQQVVDSRIVILRHIIQNIYGQQADPEEEWLAGGLDAAAQKDLLRTMTKVMKANWEDLKEMPVAQADYTTLVHAVLNEMETYPLNGFKIDSWFSGASDFPRPVQTLDNIFKCRFGEPRNDITKEAIRNFKLVYIQEMKFGREERLLRELLRVFHCVDPLRVRRMTDGSMKYSIDLAKQAKFMQIVFPAFIECGSKAGGPIMKIVLDLLTETASRIQFRIDNLNPEHMRQYITMTTAMLYAVRKALEVTEEHHTSSIAMVKYTRAAIASVCLLTEAGIEIDEETHGIYTDNTVGIYNTIKTKYEFWESTQRKRPRVRKPRADSHLADEETVLDCWDPKQPEAWNLVPEESSWFLSSEPREPELNEEERELREFARAELKALEWLGGFKKSDVSDWSKEAKGLLTDVKEMALVAEDDGLEADDESETDVELETDSDE